ncbi:MAG: hypothetical protein U5N58_06835 [Actinomycetota bacterium]|nr:hypothetical protein [Actinomycetota bacterium]
MLRSVADRFLSAIANNNTVVLNSDQAAKVTDLVVKDGEIVKELMGKDCPVLLGKAGMMQTIQPSWQYSWQIPYPIRWFSMNS